ncbi:MAG: type II secretion system F family protein [Phycicoccus sp.]
MVLVLSALPGLLVVGCLALLVAGVRLLRSDPVADLDVDDLMLRRPAQGRRAAAAALVTRSSRPLVPVVLRIMGPRGRERLRRMIDQAGRPDGATVESVATQLASGALMMAPATLLLIVSGLWWMVPVAVCVVVGLPLLTIVSARRSRQERIDRDLPDFLDVVAVTVVAGGGFRAALQTVADRFEGPVSQEVRLALEQNRAGASLREAFSTMRDRNASDRLSSFVTAYLQAEELGAPLADTLTGIAADLRRADGQARRRQAARVAPRVTLVTTLVMMPGALALVFVGLSLDIGARLGQIPGFGR